MNNWVDQLRLLSVGRGDGIAVGWCREHVCSQVQWCGGSGVQLVLWHCLCPGHLSWCWGALSCQPEAAVLHGDADACCHDDQCCNAPERSQTLHQCDVAGPHVDLSRQLEDALVKGIIQMGCRQLVGGSEERLPLAQVCRHVFLLEEAVAASK